MMADYIAANAFAQTIAADAGAIVHRESNGALIESLGLGAAASATSTWKDGSFLSRIFCKLAR